MGDANTEKKYPDFVETCGFGRVDGICGANCRHSFSVYVEGMKNSFEKYDSEENKELYKKEQKQRAYERNIRNTKRELMGMMEAVKKCQDEGLKAELQKEVDKTSYTLKKQNDAYTKFCGENNLRRKTERAQIAEWGREQARESIAAAKRYEKGKS